METLICPMTNKYCKSLHQCNVNLNNWEINCYKRNNPIFKQINGYAITLISYCNSETIGD